jgi:hypothetical protein
MMRHVKLSLCTVSSTISLELVMNLLLLMNPAKMSIHMHDYGCVPVGQDATLTTPFI